MKTQTYALKPSWSRLIHRIHTLGKTQQMYLNSIAGVQEHRQYPRQVPSIKEDSCSSLDGAHLWQLNNWQQGWAVVNEGKQQASFIFSSIKGDIFHKIDLLDGSQWSCLECLLKVFVKTSTSHKIPLSSNPSTQNSSSLAIGGLSELVENQKRNGKKIKCTLPTTGGLFNRMIRIEEMINKEGMIHLQAMSSQLLIDTSRVKHIEYKRQGANIMSTLFNQSGAPQLILSAA